MPKPQNPPVQFDWNKSFDEESTRKSIMGFLVTTMKLDKSSLQEEMNKTEFYAVLNAHLPDVKRFLPSDIKISEEEMKALALLHQLASKDVLSHWNQPQPKIATALIALMSKGVISLDFQYSGGWDETSWDQDVPDVAYAAGTFSESQKNEFKKNYGCKDAYNLELFKWIKEQTEVDASDILYAFLSDSGAGDGNSYSQCFKISLDEWGLAEHSYEENEREEDEEMEEEDKV